jgi:hypothetical protein
MADRSDIILGLAFVLRKMNEMACLPGPKEEVRHDLDRKWRQLMGEWTSQSRFTQSDVRRSRPEAPSEPSGPPA